MLTLVLHTIVSTPRFKIILSGCFLSKQRGYSRNYGLVCNLGKQMAGKSVCRTHGGASTGPKTTAGRQRCAAAKTVHGRETRAIRAARDVKLRELREMEQTLKNAGLI